MVTDSALKNASVVAAFTLHKTTSTLQSSSTIYCHRLQCRVQSAAHSVLKLSTQNKNKNAINKAMQRNGGSLRFDMDTLLPPSPDGGRYGESLSAIAVDSDASQNAFAVASVSNA